MKILLTNDDGYQAPGIRILFDVLKGRGHDVNIVAPNEEKSGNSHAVSILMPLLTKKVEENIWAVYGTPADATAVALANIVHENRPDVVISGINNGYNVGRDVNYSGTVGAATEAALEGYKAIAVSMERVSPTRTAVLQEGFTRVANFVADLLGEFEHIPWKPLEVLNINHPAAPAKAVHIAECNSTCLYEPHFERMYTTHPRTSHMAVYLMGGDVRSHFTEESDDVSQVQSGFIAMSFLQARQSSTENTQKLNFVAQKLNKMRTP
jgi:5'-nucleotidase